MELRVLEEHSPDDVDDRWKETLTFVFLLTRRRLPISACCARRSLDTGGLSGLRRTSCAALVEGLVGCKTKDEDGSVELDAWGASLILGRPRGLPL